MAKHKHRLMPAALVAFTILALLSISFFRYTAGARADDDGDLQAIIDSHQDTSGITPDGGNFPPGPGSVTGTGHECLLPM